MMNRRPFRVFVGVALWLVMPLVCAQAQTQKSLPMRGTILVGPEGDVPTDQWVYWPQDLIECWIPTGFPGVKYSDRMFQGRSGSRRALRVAEFVQYLQIAIVKMDAPDGAGAQDLAKFPKLRDALDKLLAEFAPEIGERGVDAAAARKRLAAIVRNAEQRGVTPFADVPPKHWAAPSVARLSNAGIVIGFGDGSYRGGRP